MSIKIIEQYQSILTAFFRQYHKSDNTKLSRTLLQLSTEKMNVATVNSELQKHFRDVFFPSATPTSAPTQNNSAKDANNDDSSDSLSHDSIIGLMLGLAIIILGLLRISCCFSQQWLRCCGYYSVKPEETIPVCEMQPIVPTFPVDTPQFVRYHQVHPDPAVATSGDAMLQTPVAVPVHDRSIQQAMGLQRRRDSENMEEKQDDENGGHEATPTVHAVPYHDEIVDTYPSLTPYSLPRTAVHRLSHQPPNISSHVVSPPPMVVAQPLIQSPISAPVRGLVLGDDTTTEHILSGIITQNSPQSSPMRGQHQSRRLDIEENHVRSASPV